jgi:hypothetical protein
MKRFFAVVTFLVMTLSLAAAQRLPEVARPENYKLTFAPELEKAKFPSLAAAPRKKLKSRPRKTRRWWC